MSASVRRFLSDSFGITVISSALDFTIDSDTSSPTDSGNWLLKPMAEQPDN
jgi:hypothetical protein